MQTRLTGWQEAMIDYLVLCSVNQGEAYRNGQNAAQAVQTTINENRRLNAHQLQGGDGHPRHISRVVRKEAERRTAAQWAEE